MRKLGLQISQISKLFDCSKRTIYNWLSKNKNKESSKVGRPLKIKKHMELLISDYINSKVLITQKLIQKYILDNFNIKIHQSSVSRLLKRLNISYKKVSKIYSEKKINNDDYIKDFKKEYVNENILAMDECGFYMNHSLYYGYASKNKRAYIKTPGNKGKRYSLILCVSKDNRIINYELRSGSINSIIIKGFFDNMSNEKGFLVLDNASIHKAKIINKTDYDFKFKYLPPYSPMLNPTEFCFSIIKHFVRKEEPRTFESLKSIIINTLDYLKKDNKLKNIFNHCFPL